MNFLKNLILFSLIFIAACGSTDDDNSAVSTLISINPANKFEGNENSALDFQVQLNVAVNAEVSVDFTTRNKSAVAGSDFTSKSGTLIFAAGELDKTISIEIIADIFKEADEQFEIVLSNPKNAKLIGTVAVGTILNDDTFLPGNGDGYITPESYPGYSLVWQDEFNGSAIDPANWKHEFGASGWGNNEWQNYTDRPENSYISDGNLVIEARKENFDGADYTSARMITAGLQEFKFGRIDIRAKLPEGQGIWPALWMLGSNFWTTGWPACGEIDIMEIIGSEPSTLHGTIHWDNNGGYATYSGSTSLSQGKFSDKFHVFSLIWDDQQIRWLLDDVEYSSADITPPGLSEFRQPYFFIFNVAVGGNWPGYPDATTVFPQRMFVDYIRVFQE